MLDWCQPLAIQFLLSHWIVLFLFVDLPLLPCPLRCSYSGPVINCLGPDFCLISRSCWNITDRCHEWWALSQPSQGYFTEEIFGNGSAYSRSPDYVSDIRISLQSSFIKTAVQQLLWQERNWWLSLNTISKSVMEGSPTCSQTEVTPGETIKNKERKSYCGKNCFHCWLVLYHHTGKVYLPRLYL